MEKYQIHTLKAEGRVNGPHAIGHCQGRWEVGPLGC